MKKCPTLSVIRELYIKITIDNTHIPTKMATIVQLRFMHFNVCKFFFKKNCKNHII